MNVRAIMNKLEDYKSDREVVVQVGEALLDRATIASIEFDEVNDVMVVILGGAAEAEEPSA